MVDIWLLYSRGGGDVGIGVASVQLLNKLLIQLTQPSKYIMPGYLQINAVASIMEALGVGGATVGDDDAPAAPPKKTSVAPSYSSSSINCSRNCSGEGSKAFISGGNSSNKR